ncbi:hypothetical protein ACFOPX_02920 [Helicobacter baculiformis]|uniref:Periplasmic protein n=1 Tax=Helicobacter baculiformis TaxID=427351 RepID=A0ABV7ZH37_9HELI|nr:hypothetical protein [Helicobacter baculiformis]
MKKRHFRLAVFLVMVGAVLIVVADFGYKFYKGRSKPASPPPLTFDDLSLELDQPKPPNPPQPSITHSSTLESKDFDYPVLERRITLEFRERYQAQKLFVRNLDAYKFFCLHEILKEKRIDFATDKKGRTTTLIIYLPNSPVRQAFLDDLRYYQIPYQFN